MTDRTAPPNLCKAVEKWRDLTERRRDYFRELHRSGRWRIYYEEEEFVARLRDIAGLCDRLTMLVKETQACEEASKLEAEHRSAA